MGGTQDIWEKSGDNYAIDYKKNNKNNKFITNENIKEIDPYSLKSIGVNKKQQFNDRHLEFFTYDSGLTLGFEKVVTGLADKVYSGPGPLLLTFKDTPSYSNKDRTNRVYMNIDGEFYNLIKPKTLRIRNNTKIFDGQIPFLKNNNKS